MIVKRSPQTGRRGNIRHLMTDSHKGLGKKFFQIGLMHSKYLKMQGIIMSVFLAENLPSPEIIHIIDGHPIKLRSQYKITQQEQFKHFELHF